MESHFGDLLLLSVPVAPQVPDLSLTRNRRDLDPKRCNETTTCFRNAAKRRKTFLLHRRSLKSEATAHWSFLMTFLPIAKPIP